MPKLYEIMLLLKPEIEAHQKSLESVRQKIKEHKGILEKETPLGEQMLSYVVASQRKGFYTVLMAKLEPKILKEFNADLAMVDGLLRYLITAKN